MSVSQIPWSAEAERRLRRRIRLLMFTMRALFFAGLLSAITGLITGFVYPLTFGLVLIVAAPFLAPKISDAVDQLGQEERIVFGVRFPGFGMLANKPRDTSRLTKWINQSSGFGNPGEEFFDRVMVFHCECGRTFTAPEMKWIPNVSEDEEEPGTAAVDPGGGRYVFLCPCGIGHYVLKSPVLTGADTKVSLDASPVDPRQSRRDEKGRR